MGGKGNIIATMTLLLFILSGSAMAQDSMGSLKVVVKDFYTEAPIAGAQVLITPCNDSGTTDFNGEFVLDPVTAYRNYQIDAEADGYIERSVGFVTVEADKETVSYVSMKQEATISGTITDGAAPVANAVLILGHYEFSYGLQYFVADRSDVTDGDGLYTLDNVDEGSYKLFALADDYVKNMVDVDAVAGEVLVQNFSLTMHGDSAAIPSIVLRTGYSGDPLPLPTVTGKRIYIDGKGSTGAVNFFWLKEEVPPGSSPLGIEYYLGEGGKVYSFIVPASGNYKMKLFVDDSEGVVASTDVTFAAANVAPEAVPSLIPGPSELPYYNNEVYPSTGGSNTVTAGSTVYLRGFGIDVNLLSPAEFNPDAPCFDIYENKNGNFSASLFDYSWTLKDKNDTDLTYLLNPSPTSENVSFIVPGGTPAGDYFTATLTVTDEEAAVSAPVDVTITAAETSICIACHKADDTLPVRPGYARTAHAIAGTQCQSCHGPGSLHEVDPANNKLSSSNWPGVCGQCHVEFAELQKANHSDPLPFGYFEPTEGRLTTCYKCHYTQGYIGAVEQTSQPFHQFSYPSTALSAVPKDSPNVSCSVCHDPHPAQNVPAWNAIYQLRTGSVGTACDTCHYEKWQNAILEGLGGTFENAYHYPGENYTPFLGANNPHRTADKCVLCHMDTSIAAEDANGVRKIGGHTMRMRDYGADQVPETVDDILNIAVCQSCHPGLTTFDMKGKQTAIQAKLITLSNMLKGENHAFLPANEPGSCARCHKGGTVPFLDDPDGVLEHAYTNYKLVLNDRSRGIHNPGYVNKLLQDSIDNIFCEGNFDCDADQDGRDAATFKADFGRNAINRPCTNDDPCIGDFTCNKNVDGSDAALFKSDFGRSSLSQACPSNCAIGDYCAYP
jgi:hypothetical protein